MDEWNDIGAQADDVIPRGRRMIDRYLSSPPPPGAVKYIVILCAWWWWGGGGLLLIYADKCRTALILAHSQLLHNSYLYMICFHINHLHHLKKRMATRITHADVLRLLVKLEMRFAASVLYSSIVMILTTALMYGDIMHETADV